MKASLTEPMYANLLFDAHPMATIVIGMRAMKATIS